MADLSNGAATTDDRSLPATQSAARAVDRGAVEVSGAVGSVDGDHPVFVEGEPPASFVDQMVVFGAQGQEIVEIGGSVAEPFDDVVDVAPLEHDVAAGVAAGAVHRP